MVRITAATAIPGELQGPSCGAAQTKDQTAVAHMDDFIDSSQHFKLNAPQSTGPSTYAPGHNETETPYNAVFERAKTLRQGHLNFVDFFRNSGLAPAKRPHYLRPHVGM